MLVKVLENGLVISQAQVFSDNDDGQRFDIAQLRRKTAMPNTARIQLAIKIVDHAVDGDNEQGFIEHEANLRQFLP